MMETIPAKDLFMMCEKLNRSALAEMPEGYSVRLCCKDELDVWKALQADDPARYEEYDRVLTDYFDRVYARQGDLFFRRCVFACDEGGKPVGTCFVWKAYDLVNTVHWFKVVKAHEGKGIGRALLSHVLGSLKDGEYPVFLHTHPSSYRAIKLYSDFGFTFLTSGPVGYRLNDLEECLPILKRVMPESAYNGLRFQSSPEYFLAAAASSEEEEF